MSNKLSNQINSQETILANKLKLEIIILGTFVLLIIDNILQAHYLLQDGLPYIKSLKTPLTRLKSLAGCENPLKSLKS